MFVMYFLLLPLLCRGYVKNYPMNYGRSHCTKIDVTRMQNQERLPQSQFVLTNITNIMEDKIDIASLLVDGFEDSNSKFILLKIIEKWNLEYLIKERYQLQQQERTNHSMITARIDNKIVGYVELGLTYVEQNESLGKVPTIGNLVVAPTMRRKGIGKCLMSEVIHIAKDIWQEDAVWLCVEAESPALKLYVDSFGFEQQCSYSKEIPFYGEKKCEILVLSKKFV